MLTLYLIEIEICLSEGCLIPVDLLHNYNWYKFLCSNRTGQSEPEKAIGSRSEHETSLSSAMRSYVDYGQDASSKVKFTHEA